ncbi:SRR1 domain containing protein [Amanita muscaria]
MTGSLSYSYTGFLPARSRKKRKGNGTAGTTSPGAKLQNLRGELVQDEWFVQCRQMIDDSLSDLKVPSFAAVICLGLGSPSSSQNACVQLAFLLEICDYLLIERQKISLYDPVFTEEDLTLLQGLQLTLILQNGLYPVEVPTMVFMPHCDMELYENFLKANWKTDMKLLIIANQLSEYVVKWAVCFPAFRNLIEASSNPLNRLLTMAPFLVQVGMSHARLLIPVVSNASQVPLLQQYAFPVSKTWPTAFNSMAVQFIPSELRAASMDNQSETRLQ